MTDTTPGAATRYCPICALATSALLCPKDGAETVVVTGFAKDAMAFEAGDAVAGTRYVITGILGKGGFGAVYAAEHTGTRQPIALKMLTVDPTTAEDDVVRRFYREAQITAQLQSRHTVRVFDIGQASNGPLFLAMEMLRGPTLEQILRRLHKLDRTMSETQAIDIAIPILKSLGEAHKVGLVHRDLKPANVMLADMGEDEPVTKVLDFGIARTEDSSLTAAGKALGTPAYMSPEQCAGKPLDGRSDLYSLGAILFRCVAGRLPFVNQNTLSLMFMHANEPVPDLRELTRQEVSEGFVACVERALAKQPGARFADAREMRMALEGLRGGAWAGTPARPHDVLPATAPALELPGTPGPKLVPPMPEADLDDEPPTLVTPASGLTVASAQSETTSALVDLVFDAEPAPGGRATVALPVSESVAASDDSARLDAGTRVDTDTLDRAPAPGDSAPPGRRTGLWAGLGLVAVAVVAAAVVLRPTGGGQGLANQSVTAEAPTGVSSPSPTPAPLAAPAAVPVVNAQAQKPPAQVAAPAPSVPAVRPEVAAEARAKAQLAGITNSLEEKIRYLEEAAALDPSNPAFFSQLKVFRQAAQEQKARAEAAAKVDDRPSPKARPTRSERARVARPASKPASKAASKPAEKEGGSDKVFIPAID